MSSALRLALGLTLGLGPLACDTADAPGLPDAGAPMGDAGGAAPSPDGGAPEAGAAVGAVRLDADRVAFGAVVVGSTQTASLGLENPGDGPVEVRVSPPEGADADAFSRSLPGGAGETFILAPGGRAELEVELRPSRAGPLLATLALDACGGTCPSAVLLTGEGVEAGTRCDAQLDLGLINLGSCRQGQVQCTNAGNLTETIRAVRIDGDAGFGFAARFNPGRLLPAQTSTATVELCPVAAGAARAALDVTVETATAVTRTIALRGEGGGADVRCAPGALDFGVVPVGAGTVRELTCSNAGLDAARLESQVTRGEFGLASAATATVPPGSSVVVRVESRAQSPGAKQGRLQVRTNDPDTPFIGVSLSAEARDVVPCEVRARPRALDLGRVPVGGRARGTVALENRENRACTLSSLGLAAGAPPELELRAPSSLTLSPRGALEVEVVFTPAAAGALRAEVEARFSDGVTRPVTVPVTAEAAAAELLVAPAAIDFGAHPVGCGAAATRMVEVFRLAGAGSVTRVQLAGSATSAFSLLGVGALPNRLEAGEALSFAVAFEPARAGRKTAEVRIFSGGATPLVVPLRGLAEASARRVESSTYGGRAVDVLFVVDDSRSMDDAQAALARAAPTIVDRVEAVGADVHLGIITTDVDDPSTAGALRGNPAFLERSSPDLLPRLADRLAPGTSGSGTERGIDAAVRASTPPLSTGTNNGFLRASADLHVVLVTDEEDASTRGVADAALALRQAAGRGALGLHALAGPPSGPGCDGPVGDADAAPRVAAFARLGGGVLGDLCGDLEAELGRILDAALGAPEVPVGGEPVPGTLEVRVNSQVVRRHAPPGTPGGWAYGIDARRIRFFPPDVPAARDAVEVAYDTRCDSGACGDGQLQAPEQCDDGNRVDTDACLACVDATCGDRVVWSGNEACDDGNVDPADACLPSCEAPRCGDGFVQRPGEDCDDGNTQPGDACPASCRFYTVSGPTRQRFQRLRTGTVLSFSGAPDPEDEGVATVTLPFSFELFGVATSTLTVSPNGVLAVGAASPDRLRANTVFPDARSPSGVIAPWWDDLIIDGGVSREGASVAYEIFGTAPRRTAVIQWRDLRLEDQSTGRHRRWRFQVQIDEATSEIRFHYGDTRQRGFNFPSTYSASVGLEAASGRVGVAGASCTPDCDGRPRRFDSRFDYPEGEVLTFTPAP